MFEGILEKVLKRILGKYIEDLDQKRFSVGVVLWKFIVLDLEWELALRRCFNQEESVLEVEVTAHFKAWKDLEAQSHSALEKSEFLSLRNYIGRSSYHN